MLELWQAEWCPYSHRVRQRLTERGVDFIVRQVEADPGGRNRMRSATGSDSIPTLVTEEGEAIEGMRPIVQWIESRYGERPDAERHREKAVADLPNFTPR